MLMKTNDKVNKSTKLVLWAVRELPYDGITKMNERSRNVDENKGQGH